MSKYYDKDKLKESLELEQIYDLLELWGGEPEYVEGGLISQTICHNLPGEGSRKLYYYENTKLFHCYTGCIEPSFDIFGLAVKVERNQHGEEWELYDAMKFIAEYFGFEGEEQKEQNEKKLADWEVIERHERRKISPEIILPQLPEYNKVILTRFIYPHILPWEQEGIDYKVYQRNAIGYYQGSDQITIPHFDINGRLIGIRGRFIDEERTERYGKYRPLLINKTLYTHPLSMNLYNLNNSKENIKASKIAIVFEGEKSSLQYQTMYGYENDISVAACGSSISSYHIALLKELGVREVIVGFDRQFQEIGDDEFKRLKSKLQYLYKKYNSTIRITAIFDKHMITKYKASPTDEGREKFEQLLKERIIPV